MKPNKTNFVLIAGVLFNAFLSSMSKADIQRYSSGLGREWEFNRPKEAGATRRDELSEIKKFLAENFGSLGPSYVWRERKRVEDATHFHTHYHLYYQGYRVDGVGLSIHYNRETGIEYASSDLESSLSVSLVSDSVEQRARVARTVSEKWVKPRGVQIKSWQWEPILFRGQALKPFRSSYLINIVPKNTRLATYLVVDADSGNVLSEFQRIRKARPTVTVKAYKDSIVSNNPLVSVDITVNNNNNNKLETSTHKVVREQGAGTERSPYVRMDVTAADYSGESSFKTVPTEYIDTCTGTDSDCANQAFDAVNVFYHLQQFRVGISDYLSALGLSLPNDPLFVVVNSKFVSFGDGFDNAGFIDEACGDGANENRCLVFLPPSRTTQSISGCSGAQTLNNLAREGFVIVHEYQHYLTDQFSGIEFGSGVGDIIHEGYSDYAAASQLSFLNNENITKGLVSFPECSGVQRDVANLLAYQETDAFRDPHYAGLSWASALWRLRGEFGPDDTNKLMKLMLKSLTFHGANPGFVSSVESLVKADKALYGGTHVERIRQLLYSEVKFLGSAQGAFKNPASLEAYVGFKGCSSVALKRNGSSYLYSLICLLTWALVTLKVGRVCKKRIAL